MVRRIECSFTKSTAVYNPKYDPCIALTSVLQQVANMHDDKRLGKALVWRNATRENPSNVCGARHKLRPYLTQAGLLNGLGY